MALHLPAPPLSKVRLYPRHMSKLQPMPFFLYQTPKPKSLILARFSSQQQQVQIPKRTEETETEESGWGKVSAVLFDMDGVLCDSEEPSRMAAVDVFAEMGVSVTADDFVPFMGTGKHDHPDK